MLSTTKNPVTKKLIRLSDFNRLISVPLILVLIVTLVGVGYLTPISVFAFSAGGLRTTIASIILSLMLQSGAGVTNQTWINTLNSSYGVESTIGTLEDCITNGLLTEVGGALTDTGLSSAIESAPAWNTLGLSDIFATTSTDVGVTVASGGVNLANTAINVGTVGTIGAYAGAVGIGAGIGVLANHLYEKYKENVKYGAFIDESEEILSNIPEGGGFSTVKYNNGDPVTYTYVYPENVEWYGLVNPNGQLLIQGHNYNDSVVYYDYSIQSGNSAGVWIRNNRIIANNGSATITIVNQFIGTYSGHNVKIFTNDIELANYISGVKNGTIQKEGPVSPDLINRNGNAKYNNHDDTVDFGNQIGDNDMNPVDEDDYQRWAQQANANTENGDTGEEQGQDFYDFLSPYITTAPEVQPNQPNVPETSRPEIPDQPDIPDKPDVTDQQIEESLGLATSIDLKEVFPFCIPFDLLAILAVFRVSNRQAPIITFTFPDGNQIVLDFSMFDGAAGLMRTLELIAFVVGLAIVTRRLIGASG